jgi:hypothetical protein
LFVLCFFFCCGCFQVLGCFRLCAVVVVAAAAQARALKPPSPETTHLDGEHAVEAVVDVDAQAVAGAVVPNLDGVPWLCGFCGSV